MTEREDKQIIPSSESAEARKLRLEPHIDFVQRFLQTVWTKHHNPAQVIEAFLAMYDAANAYEDDSLGDALTGMRRELETLLFGNEEIE